MGKHQLWKQVPISTGLNGPGSRFQPCTSSRNITQWLETAGCLLALVISVLLIGLRSHAEEPPDSGILSRSKEDTLLSVSGSFTTFLPLVGRSDVWRPFSNNSPWNIPIPPNPEIDSNSDAMIADLQE